MRWLTLALTGCLPDLGPRSAAAHAAACASCHPDHAASFARSRHADASSSALFGALRDRAERELAAGALCDRCHAPAGDALDCLTCHAAAGHVEPRNGALIADPTGPVRGPWGDTNGPHASAPGPVSDSALCGTCHDQDAFAGFREHPFATWETSPAAARGERCQDCHFSPVPGLPAERPVGSVSIGGRAQRPISPHDAPGLIGDRAVELIARGARLTRTPDGVALENLTGHALPDGASFLRELWLESRDEQGWTGDRRPLHAALFAGAEPTWDPIAADRVVGRGVAPGETREERFPADALEVCLRFRSVAEPLARALELPVPVASTIVCVPR